MCLGAAPFGIEVATRSPSKTEQWQRQGSPPGRSQSGSPVKASYQPMEIKCVVGNASEQAANDP